MKVSILCSVIGCCRHYIAVDQDNTAIFGVTTYKTCIHIVYQSNCNLIHYEVKYFRCFCENVFACRQYKVCTQNCVRSNVPIFCAWNVCLRNLCWSVVKR